MSFSDMNVSWSTPSIRSASDTEKSVFLTDIKHVESKRPKCVSAKHSGMRFGSWPEPKPLRSRCNSAVILPPEPEYDKIIQKRFKSAVQRSVQTNTDEDRKDLIKRLSRPTKSSRWKTQSARAREVGIDMNYYSWAKMNVYKDYQRVLYGDNGTVRRTRISKER